MKDRLIIVTLDKEFVHYANILEGIAKSKNLAVDISTADEYKELASMADIAFKGTKIVFIGTESFVNQAAMSDITDFQYDSFGCRIGWKGNKCTLYVSSSLSSSEYKKFIEHCRGVHLKHQDVVIPPENFFEKGFENIKKVLKNKDNRSVITAQYGTLIYEFIDNYFDAFLREDSEDTSYDDDVPIGLKEFLQQMRTNALKNLTKKQAIWCHGIIHSTALACGAIGVIPIPVADAIPITGAQVSMVIGLAKVFNNQITKSDAQVILKAMTAPLAGRALAKSVLVFIPGVGWAINGGISATITEILGWTVANDFAVKHQLNNPVLPAKQEQKRKREKLRSHAIEFPEEYGPLNKPLPKDLPKDAVGCGVRTSNALGLVTVFAVTENASMKFDEEKLLIDELHECMDEHMGLIEVKSGETASGNKYIFSIRKMRMQTEEDDGEKQAGLPLGNVYLLNMNVRLNEQIQFISGSFEEEGVTGMRDSTVYSLMRCKGSPFENSNLGDFSGWTFDPYDANYKKGFLMNLSEDAKFDEMFPEHPLSVARKFVSDFIRLN